MLLLARLTAALALGAGLAALLWALAAPRALPEAALAGLAPGDAAAGARIYHASGCASCHAAPDAKGDARDVLSGGRRLLSDFGTFVVPNISPDPAAGIGGWSLQDFASAMVRGVAPDGRHYYPAFPYTSYSRMTLQDVADLKAHLDTLPASATPSQPHELSFPFTLRRGLALWKALYLDDDWIMAEASDPVLMRGRYLAEALGHCGECHTPRTAFGGLARARWMAGAENPSGTGRIPGLTPAQLSWSASDIVYYLESGFTPEFDVVGGSMAAVVESYGKLPPEDRAAVAAYVKALAPAD